MTPEAFIAAFARGLAQAFVSEIEHAVSSHRNKRVRTSRAHATETKQSAMGGSPVPPPQTTAQAPPPVEGELSTADLDRLLASMKAGLENGKVPPGAYLAGDDEEDAPEQLQWLGPP